MRDLAFQRDRGSALTHHQRQRQRVLRYMLERYPESRARHPDDYFPRKPPPALARRRGAPRQVMGGAWRLHEHAQEPSRPLPGDDPLLWLLLPSILAYVLVATFMVIYTS